MRKASGNARNCVANAVNPLSDYEIAGIAPGAVICTFYAYAPLWDQVGGFVFFPRSFPDFTGGISVHDCNADPDNDVRPHRQCVGCDKACKDDCDIGESVIAGG